MIGLAGYFEYVYVLYLNRSNKIYLFSFENIEIAHQIAPFNNLQYYITVKGSKNHGTFGLGCVIWRTTLLYPGTTLVMKIM